MLFTSGILLFYTAMVVPVQIFLWDYSDMCRMFPTLYFDIIVDIFFMVGFLSLQLVEFLIAHFSDMVR